MNWYKKSNNAKDIEKITSLVNKMVSGKNDWNEEELQLQQNYPEIIEKMLKCHKDSKK